MTAVHKRCPNDADFLAYFVNEMGEADRNVFIEHVFSCRDCRLRFDALRALEKDLAPRLAEISEAPLDAKGSERLRSFAAGHVRELKRERRRRAHRPALRWKWASLAWAVPAAAAIILAGYFLVLRSPRTDEMRATNGTDLRLLAPIGGQAEAPSLFTWTPHADADLYFFRLIDDELEVISTGTAEKSVFRIDETARGRLVRGRTYLWTVEARADNGAPIATAKGTFVVR